MVTCGLVVWTEGALARVPRFWPRGRSACLRDVLHGQVRRVVWHPPDLARLVRLHLLPGVPLSELSAACRRTSIPRCSTVHCSHLAWISIAWAVHNLACVARIRHCLRPWLDKIRQYVVSISTSTLTLPIGRQSVRLGIDFEEPTSAIRLTIGRSLAVDLLTGAWVRLAMVDVRSWLTRIRTTLRQLLLSKCGR